MTRKVFALIAAALIATASPALADTWTIGLYLCGSDLESRAGAATSDIVEAIGADLSDEINFIVMTGGSNEWKNEAVDASKLQIWKVANSDIGLLTEMPTKNNTHRAQASLGGLAPLEYRAMRMDAQQHPSSS